MGTHGNLYLKFYLFKILIVWMDIVRLRNPIRNRTSIRVVHRCSQTRI